LGSSLRTQFLHDEVGTGHGRAHSALKVAPPVDRPDNSGELAAGFGFSTTTKLTNFNSGEMPL
jgi:hypothetical protein